MVELLRKANSNIVVQNRRLDRLKILLICFSLFKNTLCLRRICRSCVKYHMKISCPFFLLDHLSFEVTLSWDYKFSFVLWFVRSFIVKKFIQYVRERPGSPNGLNGEGSIVIFLRIMCVCTIWIILGSIGPKLSFFWIKLSNFLFMFYVN